jgi:hypothetical protein
MSDDDLTKQLTYLKLPYILENHEAVGQLAARKQWTHVHFQNLFRLKFIEDKSNVVFIGGVWYWEKHIWHLHWDTRRV